MLQDAKVDTVCPFAAGAARETLQENIARPDDHNVLPSPPPGSARINKREFGLRHRAGTVRSCEVHRIDSRSARRPPTKAWLS